MDGDRLIDCGEFFAAGFFRDPEASVHVRMAQAVACHFDHIALPPWRGRRLYPAERESETSGHLYGGGSAVHFHYTAPLGYDRGRLQQKIADAEGPHRQALLDLQEAMEAYPGFVRLGGWIHASVNYRRILSEGLTAYPARIQSGRTATTDPARLAFYDSVQIAFDAVRGLHARIVNMLGDVSDDDPTRIALLEALGRVPFEPATTFYEAMVAENFIFYVDGCDGLGRFDQDLYPYYKTDLEAGRITREEALGLIEELWFNFDGAVGWNIAIGGTAPDGGPGINELTLLCLEASRRVGKAKPNLALRLRENTPDAIWQEAFASLATGTGQPALYCEENYLRSIRQTGLGLSEEDLPDYAFGGCTELIVHGKSCCGGADTHFNLPRVLDKSIHTHLVGCQTFEEFFEKYTDDLRAAAQEAANQTNAEYERLAQWQPQPIRSLLIDDCIERGVEYHAGGARYNWSVTTVGGIANAADSLHALREFVFERKELSAQEMVGVLAANFEGHEELRLRLAQCASYGNDDARVDDLAARVCDVVFRKFLSMSTWRGGKFVPGCIMLDWYVWFGDDVGALPDGRKAGEPISDSAGPYQGRDRTGPTAMLASVARIPQHLAPGTLVLNARFSRDLFSGEGSTGKLGDLVRTYFKLGGMQMQVNVVDQQTLVRAMEDPGKYAHLIVRIGGFSAYWGQLGDRARRAVMERCEHA